MVKRIGVFFLVAILLTQLILPASAAKEDPVIVEPMTQSRTSGFAPGYTLTGSGAADMVSIALAQEGRTGSQFGYTEEWCADFVSDCAIIAGQNAAIPQYGGVEGLKTRIINAGGWVTTTSPQPGDICFIDWNKSGGYGHVEIVYEVSGTTVSTIGGNSGSGSTLYSRCVKKHPSLNSGYITCIVRPKYAGTSAPITAPTVASLSTDHTSYEVDEPVIFSIVANGNVNNLWIYCPNGDTLTYTDVGSRYELAFGMSGHFQALVETWNGYGSKCSEKIDFYVGNPTYARLSINKTYYAVDERVYFTIEADGIKNVLWIYCPNGDTLTYEDVGYAYDLGFGMSGHFQALVQTWNGVGSKCSDLIDFYVGNQTITVTFNPNGGSVSPTSKTVTIGSTYGSLPTPTRTYYTFDGWFTATSGGSKVTSSTTVTATTNHTLYAHWTHVCASGHNYSYAVTTDPTTSATGVLTGTCSRCGGKTTITLPKLNTSDYTYTITKAATCTATGTGRYTWKTTTYGSFHFDVTIPKTAHSYTTSVTPPTCTAQGYTTHTCSACGDTYKDNYTAALGHNYIYSVTTTPTATSAGVLTGTCSRCNTQTSVALPKLNTTDYTYTITKVATCTATGTGRYTWKTTTYGSFHFDVTIPKTAHSYTTSVTPPTCTTQGYTTHTCSACGDTFKDSYINALGHSWDAGTVTQEPTETEPGIKIYTCTRCGETKVETIPTLEHTHQYVATVIAPTCTERGYTIHACVCGDSYVDTYTAAIGHAWDTGVVTTKPTENATGIMTYTCTRCGETKTEIIPKLEPDPTPGLPCDGGDSCPGVKFTDMPAKGHWAHDPIDWAIVKGVTSGNSATTFGPNVGCTRAQVVTFLWRAAGSPEPTSSNNPFRDVNGGYYYKAVLWAVEEGITSGTSDTTFSPNETCTRAQIVTFLWRFEDSPIPKATSNPFTDVKSGSYYEKAVLWASENGVTAGTSATTFSPNAVCTRAQIVTFLYRDIEG